MGQPVPDFQYSPAIETSAAPSTQPPPIPVWQPPLDASLRREALRRAIEFCGVYTGWDCDDVVNTAEAFLKFLKGEPPATD